MLAIRENLVMPQIRDWYGKRVIVIGAARQGIALARYLTHHGADVVINDRLQVEKLESAREALADEQIEWICGGHPIEMLEGTDMVFISGGVPFDLPIVREAKSRGIEISNDSQIFLEECPCRVIGITGSSGKTTTTTLVGLIAKAAIDELSLQTDDVDLDDQDERFHLTSVSKVWVGGNIGTPLLSVVDQIQANDLAVMELSSFQLEVMSRSPHIAGILNITPNHLDRHKTMEAYTAAKARILEFQTELDIAVLNEDDPTTWSLADKTQRSLVTFSKHTSSAVNENVYFDAHTNSVKINFQSADDQTELRVIGRDEIPLRGEHNLQNVLAACAIAWAAELPVSAMAAGISQFEGIPHRLDFVRKFGGGDWYNDSIATAPERAIAAINSFSEPMILLAGGQDKDLPWDGFASLVRQRVKVLILFGEAAGLISDALERDENISKTEIVYCSGLKEAVLAAANKVSEGDVVLLSPGGTSFDEFHDFEDRGEAFRKWVLELQ
jgi:UDP-N-acetylmuramoylalanine--D-glutamate ligase